MIWMHPQDFRRMGIIYETNGQCKEMCLIQLIQLQCLQIPINVDADTLPYHMNYISSKVKLKIIMDGLCLKMMEHLIDPY